MIILLKDEKKPKSETMFKVRKMVVVDIVHQECSMSVNIFKFMVKRFC